MSGKWIGNPYFPPQKIRPHFQKIQLTCLAIHVFSIPFSVQHFFRIHSTAGEACKENNKKSPFNPTKSFTQSKGQQKSPHEFVNVVVVVVGES